MCQTSGVSGGSCVLLASAVGRGFRFAGKIGVHRMLLGIGLVEAGGNCLHPYVAKFTGEVWWWKAKPFLYYSGVVLAGWVRRGWDISV